MTCPRLCGHTGGLRTPGPVLWGCYLLLLRVSAAWPSLSPFRASVHLHELHTFPSPSALAGGPCSPPQVLELILGSAFPAPRLVAPARGVGVGPASPAPDKHFLVRASHREFQVLPDP